MENQSNKEMRYSKPIFMTEKEINGKLKCVLEINEREQIIISALYYLPTKKAGDILLYEFVNFSSKEKNNIMLNLFPTFYQMHRTDYRGTESIELLKEFKKESPEYAEQIDEAIEEVIELLEIFSLDK